MTDTERSSLAAENARISAEAIHLASQQIQQDIQSGQKLPEASVAEQIKERLIKEDFTPKT